LSIEVHREVHASHFLFPWTKLVVCFTIPEHQQMLHMNMLGLAAELCQLADAPVMK
jgi:hypothetical protein